MLAAFFMKKSVYFICLIIFASCNTNRMHYLSNQQLKTIKPNHNGNALNGNRFVNYQNVALPTFFKVLRWRTSKNPQQKEKKLDTWKPEIVFSDSLFTNKQDKIVWLGHASFLITLNGKNFITDPVFGNIPFVKRLIGLPFGLNQPMPIDYVLLSHAHFDHCDKKSLQLLASKNNTLKVLAPLKSTRLLREFAKNIEVQEAGWYQQFNINDEAVEIYYMPAFHWYKRTFNDDNQILWGSFVIKYKGKTIFFMGDSGYNLHFTEIAQYFNAPDYCIMGVGAYKPSYMMQTSHTSPQDAVKAFHDLNGKTFIPMHYGTFDLADEPLSEPLQLLKNLESNNQINGKLLTPKVGEVILID